jgi:hypothetical protein
MFSTDVLTRTKKKGGKMNNIIYTDTESVSGDGSERACESESSNESDPSIRGDEDGTHLSSPAASDDAIDTDDATISMILKVCVCVCVF